MYTDRKDKIAAVFSYFGWVFWVIGLIIRSPEDRLSLHHLNQGLVLTIAATVVGALRVFGLFKPIPAVLWIVLFLFRITGFVRAIKGSDEPLPLIGDIKVF